MKSVMMYTKVACLPMLMQSIHDKNSITKVLNGKKSEMNLYDHMSPASRSPKKQNLSTLDYFLTTNICLESNTLSIHPKTLKSHEERIFFLEQMVFEAMFAQM
jgi:hypothetical protein